MTTVEQIHQDFDLAQELLLDEAKKIINANQVTNGDHIDKMRELGFVNSEVVKHAEKKQQALVSGNNQAQLITRYKIEYPLLKFLTEGKLDEICDKYGLIYAPVKRYKKDVPPKNLKEIENAQVLKGDDDDSIRTIIKSVNNNAQYNKFLRLIGKTTNEFTGQEVDDLHMKYRGYVPKDWGIGSTMEFHDAKEKLGVDFRVRERETVDRSGLFIAAPKSHFNLKGLSRKGKGFFQTVIKKEVKDPIVFRYVKGGIQVLSKWGDEANDPELVNGINN